MGGIKVGDKKIKTKRTILVVFLGILIITVATKALSLVYSSYDNDKSLYFVQLINYTLPVAKITTFNSEDLAESNRSLKESFWGVFGVDINSPVTFLSKEISLLNTKYVEVNAGSVENLSPYTLSDSNILSEPVKVAEDNAASLTLDANKPLVFIYHSHTTESYLPTKNNSKDETKNVCAVGDALEYELEKNYGVSTVHDKTMHDALGDIAAYSKSRDTVNKYLKQYGSFKLIIDIHRDSSPNKKSDSAVINKEGVAKCMFVMCQEGPYSAKNMAIANKMMNISNSQYPQLFKNIYTEYHKGTLYFNQDLSSNSVLLEVGTNLNSVTEAKTSSKYIAKIISEYLKTK